MMIAPDVCLRTKVETMSERIVDARGEPCPRPLIKTKRALDEMQVDEPLTIQLDNEVSRDNVVRFLRDKGASPEWTVEQGVFSVKARKPAGTLSTAQFGPSCIPTGLRPSHVVAFTRDGMGSGSEELGRILVQACVNAIREVSPLPSAIVFYNGGVLLACEGSPVIEPLAELAARGVRLMVCGTCLGFHGLKEKVKVGTISNLFEILQVLTDAGHVVTP